MPNQYYPTPAEVDHWCADLLARADAAPVTATAVEQEAYSFTLAVRHTANHQFLAFTRPDGSRFYGFWQPAFSEASAPLLVHVPGYGAEMSAHPELVAAGFNVLHISPLGYATPTGPAEVSMRYESWPVLSDTVLTLGAHGYNDWLADAVTAVRWAQAQPNVQPERVGAFGTSQGGGGSLLLASLLRERGVRAVSADVPFLTDFAMMFAQENAGAYYMANTALREVQAQRPDDLPQAWRALGFIDTLSHAHRLTMPTLLTAGSCDDVCPPPTIQQLFSQLPGTRSYTEMAGQGHAYTVPFLRLAEAWFKLYV